MMKHRIAFHGVPRSGTSWIGSIFDSSPSVCYRHQPLFSYAFKDRLSDNSSSSEIDTFFGEIALSEDDFITQSKEKLSGLIPSFAKEEPKFIIYKEARYHHIIQNLLVNHKSVKVVGVVRNPYAVLASWFNAPKEFDKVNWSFEKEWRNAESKNQGKPENFYGYEKWKEVSQLFLDLGRIYLDRFYLIEYKNLLKDTEAEVKKLFGFCGIEYQDQTAKYLESGRKKDTSDEAYSVYRIKNADDGWQGVLPAHIVTAIEKDLGDSELKRFLL